MSLFNFFHKIQKGRDLNDQQYCILVNVDFHVILIYQSPKWKRGYIVKP